jgi:hypothetical protein
MIVERGAITVRRLGLIAAAVAVLGLAGLLYLLYLAGIELP